ncbi:heavy metal translocating P-type ATPase [Microbulbifer sp. 2205BS26-8]|uniref:heavy metal translocating P-type ATPase n=1 Tax=Microbulbifer sp. 2205BS26-8 TaxID=3064386 RepID=UPI00273D45FA|nr:heavy metal translocating P-type ATPase [Microbulbifer sp. 2205BS26-8]MDP5211002.1 heavy metal translocating P-type ATPase [Microbulbifer sp. 2205BS26-8]
MEKRDTGCGCEKPKEPLQQPSNNTVNPDGETSLFSIGKMDCPTEESLIRAKLSNIHGIYRLDFNLVQRILTVGHKPGMEQSILDVLAPLDLDTRLATRVDTEGAPPAAKANWWLLGAATIAALASELVYWLQGGNTWLVFVLALAAISGGGLFTYKKGWIALKNLNLNMNALMSIAVTGAILIGHWPEAAMVMVLFTLAELIEAKSLDRARNAIRELLNLTPETATMRQEDGHWHETDAKQVPLGAIVRVRPGERIALDGEVIKGNSAVNQAPITGESLPVDKTAGDELFAGTINESGALEYKVTAAANDAVLARIIHAVEEAQGSRAPTQRLVDQFAHWYTPLVFAVALATALLPPLFFGGAWMEWIYRALVLLVIACPCALVIATPVTIVSGLAAATRHGTLIKGGAYLEQGRRLRWIALDKTGTITHGKPEVTDFEPCSGTLVDKVKVMTASLASRSDHPVSKAIAEYLNVKKSNLEEVETFEALAGRGLRGEIAGKGYYLGNHRLVEELKVCSPELELLLGNLESQGKTVVMLVGESGVIALFAVADTVKESSRQAIEELHGLGVKTLMLTGDNQHTADVIAREVGIDRAEGNLLPEDKLQQVESLAGHGRVGMVGDGINDAPALARADIGFAMGAAGTDTAIETADVALMDDNLGKIAGFIRLSRTTAHILWQNIILALGIKAIFLVLAFAGEASMWMAVFADMGTSLLVVFNGLRLMRK